MGGHLAEGFRDAGWLVRAVVRPGSTKALPAGVESVTAGLDSASLARAIEGCDVLVHAAGVTRAARASAYDAVNVAGTRAATEAANTTGARLILISSQAAIGAGTIERPAREDDVPRPLTAYGRSKVAAEEVVRTAGRTPWTIIRPVSVYGPRDRQFVPLFRLASRGVFLQTSRPSTPYTFIYVSDLVTGVVLAASSPRAVGQAMFFGHAKPLTADELLRSLANVFGRRYRPWRVPALAAVAWAGEVSWLCGKEPPLDRARLVELRAEGFVCSTDRARQLLGFSASVSLEDGIERTARWYRAQGWL